MPIPTQRARGRSCYSDFIEMLMEAIMVNQHTKTSDADPPRILDNSLSFSTIRRRYFPSKKAKSLEFARSPSIHCQLWKEHLKFRTKYSPLRSFTEKACLMIILPKDNHRKSPIQCVNPRLILGYLEILIAVQVPYTLAENPTSLTLSNMFQRNPDVALAMLIRQIRFQCRRARIK
ncbi:hypothetical protein CDAR_215941 [Caerostris darwini]|uniref:Uncharacterized protein n=1 Tax=Caerostris darwini TaxID=1538125 RepID=A0AAV4NL65_9ARAC|nr:hypothetical protein CDAR_215941 [Caerostris darwini]